MKLICLPYQSPCFYLKPDTALLRDGHAFYVPEHSSRIEGALALVVKIDRLGRHIAPRFAARYYQETALGFCLYAADLLEQNRARGAAWGRACSYDYSAPLADSFKSLLQYPVSGTVFSWRSEKQSWNHILQDNPIDPILSDLSQYVFLKMGDLIWIELHPPVSLSVGEEVDVYRDKVQELRFSVR